jgi:membrane protein implicated in regulation of membrane protease activity
MLGALLVIVFFGFAALLIGFSRWLAHRPWAAAGNVAIGVLLFALAYAHWPAVMHLRTYERIPANAKVAQVYCERTGAKTYRVTLTRFPSGRMQIYEIGGDEWRLDARTLVWKERAAKLGLPASFRLERLSARYLRTERPAAIDTDSGETMRLPEGFALADADEVGEDVWSQARTGQRWAGEVEPGRVYGPWRPLVDKTRFDVWMTLAPGSLDVRLEARPANEAGIEALGYTRTHDDNVRTPQG